jgi:sec-independent protein translocase protein TatA
MKDGSSSDAAAASSAPAQQVTGQPANSDKPTIDVEARQKS